MTRREKNGYHLKTKSCAVFVACFLLIYREQRLVGKYFVLRQLFENGFFSFGHGVLFLWTDPFIIDHATAVEVLFLI